MRAGQGRRRRGLAAPWFRLGAGICVALAGGCALEPRAAAPRLQTFEPYELPDELESEREPDEGEADRGTARAWLAARGLDLLDVVSVRVGFGPGLLAHARATRWIALGAGALGPVRSWEQGFFVPCYGLGWLRREGGTWIEDREELGISTFYFHESFGETLAGNRVTFGPDARGAWDVGAELHLALVGLAAEVRLDEVQDALAGLWGADPALDDGR